jgi:hypothetical protein
MHKNGDKAELSRVNEAYRNFVKVQLVPLAGFCCCATQGFETAKICQKLDSKFREID